MRCFHPRIIHCESNGHSYEVPCNKCPACRKRKQQEWVFRMDMERKYSGFRNCFFCTLTYDESIVPEFIDTDTGEISKVLCLQHCTDFWKRFRRYSGEKVRYFMCGEYGDRFDRPHYHFIIYTNLSWKDCLNEIKHSWSYSVSSDTPLGYGVFERDNIYKTRRKLFGLVTLSAVQLRRMRYCAKYIVKDSNSSAVVPKFARCSRGLGKCYLTQSLEWLPLKRNLTTVVYTSDSKPASLPRYFRNKIFTPEERDFIARRIESDLSCPIQVDFDNPDLNRDKVLSWYLALWKSEAKQVQSITLNQFNSLHLYG